MRACLPRLCTTASLPPRSLVSRATWLGSLSTRPHSTTFDARAVRAGGRERRSSDIFESFAPPMYRCAGVGRTDMWGAWLRPYVEAHDVVHRYARRRFFPDVPRPLATPACSTAGLNQSARSNCRRPSQPLEHELTSSSPFITPIMILFFPLIFTLPPQPLNRSHRRRSTKTRLVTAPAMAVSPS